MMYRLAWRYGAKFAIPTESYLCFLELGTCLQSGMVAYCIWGEVWICVNSQLGPGRSCVQGCKGISKKSVETPGRMALAGHFAMIPHLRTYYFDLSGIYRRC